jgi:hypothetical protein
MTDLCPICLGERMIDFTHPEALEVFKNAKQELLSEKNESIFEDLE